MKRYIGFAVVAFILIVSGFVYLSLRSDRNKQAAYRNEDDVHLAHLRAALPIGTPRIEIIEYLKNNHVEIETFPSNLEVHGLLPVRPSTLWYCSTMQPYADFYFSSGTPEEAPLQQISIAERGIDCL
jgi:hypothetical protein